MYKMFRESVEIMVKDGIWKEVSYDFPCRYLPVLAVVDMQRETTKVRVCLDAKSKFKGVSLNDNLLKGEVDVVDIFQAITKARCGEYAIAGDMKKMFWQVAMSEDDQKYHGIICEGKTYVCTRVCYRDKPSPAIADQSMKEIAEFGKEEFPAASFLVKERRYVDDLQDAGSSIPDLVEKREETDELLGKFGFEVKAWHSNHPDVGQVRTNNKMLGVRWNAVKDTLSLNEIVIDPESAMVKKNVLSVVSSSWDPQGLLAGLRITGRLIFQAIVRMKNQWDDAIDDPDLQSKWKEWITEMNKCNDIEIDRSLLPTNRTSSSRALLVGFSDGSSVAHGCTVYLRWADENEGNIEVKFVGSKAKVNPIKGTTTPRAEMSGAFILSRLAYSVENALSDTEISPLLTGKVLFSDSTTVISWVKSAAIKYKPFVRNKVIEMQELHPSNVWQHIPRCKNEAADLVSKGCCRKDLDKIIGGPSFLQESRNQWTDDLRDEEEEMDNEAINSEKISDFINASPAAVGADDEARELDEQDPIIDIDEFSSWKKLVNVTAYVYKFGITTTEDVMSGSITTITEIERQKAVNYWIKQAQKVLPPENKMKTLSPFPDENGIMRINGRIGQSELFHYDQKHPVLLPKNHRVSELIVKQVHEDTIHPGHGRVMAEVRQKYWVIGLRSMAKRIGRRCVTCRKWRGAAMEQFMKDLPKSRLTPGQPFENTAVDYFGPFHVKYGYRGKKKAYGAIFTCLSTRAIHTELATDLTTDRFLMALQRFIDRYGKPKSMMSDNGTNFVGAANEIRAMIRRWKEDERERKILTDFCNDNEMEWSFSTPAAPHHNGCVEAMVKSVKNALNKIVRQHVLTEEEFRTVLSKVTTCVNSRPLWPSSEDSMDKPIRPIDLLRPAELPVDPEELNESTNVRRRYQRVQSVADEWWKLWMRNFVPNLQARSKWFKQRENVCVGDIVLVIDKDVARSKWNMGRVEEVYPGSDGLVRSVKVRTVTGIYDRPITKLVMLLSKEEQLENAW